jgi:hypothetical protein
VDPLDDGPSLFTTIWFDPGGITGWCVAAVYPECLKEPNYKIMDNLAFWSCGEFAGREDEIVDAMLGLVEAWEDSTVIGIEDFILRQFRQDRALLSPVRITAAFEYGLRGTGLGKKRGRSQGRRALLQSSSDAMNTMTDERLKDAGLYNPTIMPSGDDHARDAVRHAFTFLRRQRQAYLAGKGDLTRED